MNEWLRLRPLNGDIKYGFEELVCQLARAEKIPGKQKFVRVAAPDGGVEGYCGVNDDEEYGWQAKFFLSMGDGQWSQLDESFEKAFSKHPRLVRYYICLPLDRQDPRIDNQKWFMDKWNARVERWTAFAKAKGRLVSFEYWGSSDLFDRLSRAENEGRQFYWFGSEEFSDRWIGQELEESIRGLGKRYTPKLNVELPIVKVFDGLARNDAFAARFLSYLDDLLKKYKQAVLRHADPQLQEAAEKIALTIEKITRHFKDIDFADCLRIDTNLLVAWLSECRDGVSCLTQLLEDRRAAAKDGPEKPGQPYDERQRLQWDIDFLGELDRSSRIFSQFLKGEEIDLANNPFLLLTGEAGIGKSHLLADIAERRAKRNQPSILLLGQRFTTEEPWSHIKKQLHLQCERDTFLGALNARAEVLGSRILLLIDALNEGDGKKLWKNYIGGFIAAIRRFPYLGLVLSVRSSYERVIIPKELIDVKELIRIRHSGFADHEYEAAKLFFETYSIKQPAIPLLHPEFSNPLFLKTFCEGLHKRRLHEIPEGYEGISAILDFYLSSVNEVVSEKHHLPLELGLVRKISKRIVGKDGG
jgi:hypothetical protein